MVFQAVPDTAEVTIVADLAGQVCTNTLFYKNAAAWGETELQELVDAIWAVWAVFVDDELHSNYILQRVEAKDLRTAIGVQAVTDETPVPGTKTGTTVPNNVALAVARRSGLTGRSTRGRLFIPLTTEANTESTNVASTSFATACESVLDAMDAAMSAIDWTAVIVSRVQNLETLPVALTYDIVSWIVVDRVLDSMRRRLPGRGA